MSFVTVSMMVFNGGLKLT